MAPASAQTVGAAAHSTALFPLAPLLPGAGSEWRVGVVDVGAMSLGDSDDVYTPLQRQQLCDVVGFEPAPGQVRGQTQRLWERYVVSAAGYRC